MAIPSASEWKKLLKANPKADDASLTKALDDFARSGGKGDAGAQLEALLSQARAAKKNPKNKELGDFLDDLIKDVEKEKVKAARDAKAAEDEAEDEDEAGGALKSSLIRVKKLGEDRPAPFVLALGKVPGLVIARRPPITRDHKNDARAMRQGNGKLMLGTCFSEDGKYIFVFDVKPAGGMTKLLKRAAKLHAGMEIRLKVRGGGDEIDDESDSGEMTDFGSEAVDGVGNPAATPAESPDDTPAPTAGGPANPAEQFTLRARTTRALLDALVASDPGRAAPIRSEFASALGHAQARRYDQASAMLDAIDARLRAAPPAADARPAAPTGGEAPAPATATATKAPSLVVLQQSRLAWNAARNKAHQELDALRSAVLQAAKGEPGYEEIVASVQAFVDLKNKLDTTLLDTLDEALNANDPADRAAINRKAGALIRGYQDDLSRDPLLGHLDGNPFLSVSVEKTLASTLDYLARTLGA